MSIRYLIDENLDPFYKAQLLRKGPNTVVYALAIPAYRRKALLTRTFSYGVRRTIFCW